ncbi:restriction endonuclease [Nitrosomonas ureae]|uniref:Restriction system protein n=1 Tax=Nitrosomonas ureae TaxID=44577 RepID=A0A1H9F2P0_9PROT|nr:restriction endonuclease [Nitrosomonas ureae]SEQ32212.1 restriction system protein [Nitrosomonas ureae]
MARRKTSLVEDLLDFAAALPWWASTTLAIISYVALSHYAAPDPQPVSIVPGQIGHIVVKQISRTFALYGQYILPFLFLIGAVISVLKRHERRNLIHRVGNKNYSNALQNITWREFELLVGEAFRMRGFSVTETGGGGADDGIDLVLRKDSEIFLVQCKQWRAYKVSVNIVRELLGVMITKGAAGGFVVTSGVFTAEAHLFAKGQNIELIDGSKLAAMIEKVREASSFGAFAKYSDSLPPPELPATAMVTPHCPQCGDTMVKRVAKKGVNAGSVFWGCTGFPRCRGVRSVD